MKIVVTGSENRVSEFRKKLDHDFVFDNSLLYKKESLSDFDLIVDLNADERNEIPAYFSCGPNTLLILSSVKKSLAEMIRLADKKVECAIAGFNALPTFIGRDKTEISFYRNEDRNRFEIFNRELNFDFLEVQDRVGMATPRVICMIINEACFTLQEGTASVKDIDKGMKLGTNYPIGPFEWCDRIGIKDVYETLNAVWNDTHDERYKICPLLKTKYLKGESFYQ